MRRDLVLAAGGLALAAVFWAGAHALPRSMLSDGVGADGVPKGLAVALATFSILIALRRKREEGAPELQPRAFGIAVLGFVYVALAPLVGYGVAITLLTAAAALYYGAPRGWTVGAFALGSAAILWASFGWMLGIRLPG